MPGVKITTSVISGLTNPGVSTGRFQIGGITATGPIDVKTLVRSITEYTNRYGERESYAGAMYDTARTFFEEGGSELIVARAVGPAAQAASSQPGHIKTGATVRDDVARVSTRQPTDTLNDTKVTFTLGEDFSGTVRLWRPDSTANGTTIEVVNIPAQSNTDGFIAAYNLRSQYLQLARDTATTTANLDEVTLTGGNDDRSNVDVTHVIEAFSNDGPEIAGGAVAVPGFDATIVNGPLDEYCSLSTTVGITAIDSSIFSHPSDVDGLGTADILGASRRIGVFYGNTVISDGSGTRTITPEGYVGGARSRVHTQVGFWGIPAGQRSLAQWVESTVPTVNETANELLAAAKINGIVTLPNSAPRIYGYRSRSNDEVNFRLLKDQDFLNGLSVEIKAALEEFVFAPIDGRNTLFGQIESVCVGILQPISDAGGLYPRVVDGDEKDPGYRVTVDQSNNTLESLQLNEVNVTLAVRLSPTAELIQVEIRKVPLGGNV